MFYINKKIFQIIYYFYLKLYVFFSFSKSELIMIQFGYYLKNHK
jgi:hypothetical protein